MSSATQTGENKMAKEFYEINSSGTHRFDNVEDAKTFAKGIISAQAGLSGWVNCVTVLRVTPVSIPENDWRAKLVNFLTQKEEVCAYYDKRAN